MFGFWRDCRYKPCRAARRCVGDQGACLESRWIGVPYDEGIAAYDRMRAATPRDGDVFVRMAHHYPHHSLCLHDPKNQKTRAKRQAKKDAEQKARQQTGRQAAAKIQP